jgi:hypothetical protein
MSKQIKRSISAIKMYILLVATVDRTAQLLGTVVLIQEVMSNLLKVLEMGTDFKKGIMSAINARSDKT